MKNQITNSLNSSGKILRSGEARKVLSVDGVHAVRRAVLKPKARTYTIVSANYSVPFRPPKSSRTKKVFTLLRANTKFAVTAASLVLAFGFGMWYALSTPKTVAEEEIIVPQVKSASISAPIPLAEVTASTSTQAAISNDILFNTPLAMLKDYLAEAGGKDKMAERKAKLREFLKQRGSPFESQVDVIAEQDHWKLILAISFAESTLGKSCYMNNCSGIGGSNIRTYHTLQAWVLDFNRLLEKRYKNKTLEQMCGVYVQPCNPNWLLATKQILTALEEAEIN